MCAPALLPHPIAWTASASRFTHLLSWHGLLLRALWLPVFSLSLNPPAVQPSLSMVACLPTLFLYSPRGKQSLTVFTRLSSSIACCFSTCWYSRLSLNRSICHLFPCHYLEMNGAIVQRSCCYVCSRSEIQNIVQAFIIIWLPLINEEPFWNILPWAHWHWKHWQRQTVWSLLK